MLNLTIAHDFTQFLELFTQHIIMKQQQWFAYRWGFRGRQVQYR